jgi:hypothetical protein
MAAQCQDNPIIGMVRISLLLDDVNARASLILEDHRADRELSTGAIRPERPLRITRRLSNRCLAIL